MDVSVFFPTRVVAIEVAAQNNVFVIWDKLVGEGGFEELAHRVDGIVVAAVVVDVDNHERLIVYLDLESCDVSRGEFDLSVRVGGDVSINKDKRA